MAGRRPGRRREEELDWVWLQLAGDFSPVTKYLILTLAKKDKIWVRESLVIPLICEMVEKVTFH